MNPARADIQRIAGYVPGEQPQESGWVKLNTNENPYPPSPRVIEAIRAAAEGRLNVYPDPLVTRFRTAAAKLFEVDPDGILPANGSDENLTILMRTFVDAGDRISFPYPSYVLYQTLAEIQGAQPRRIPLRPDWSFDLEAAQCRTADSKLTFVPNPNSPSGNRWGDDVIRALVPPRGILVLDEAYGEFADEPQSSQGFEKSLGTLGTGEAGRRIVITRTLSKSYSLAGIRFGFALADPALIAEMRKVKDSYNCNTLSIAAATAAIEDQDWMQSNIRRIQTTRSRLTGELLRMGFAVVPSQANFVWATHPEREPEPLYQALKQRRVLVRYMKFPGCGEPGDQTVEGLRITVGTDEEIDRFLEVLVAIMNHE